MSVRAFSSVFLLVLAVIGFPETAVGATATDMATHQQIQEALPFSVDQMEGKILSLGSWVGDVFVLPYSPSDPYDIFVGGNLNVGPRKWIALSFLEDNPDDYDFLLVLTRFEFGGEDGISGFYWEIRNDVEGIGIGQFDISQEFGSARLQGFIDGGSLSQYVLEDGSVDSDRVEVVLNHELAHRWSARCSFVDDDGGISTDLLGLDGAHWSYLLDSDASYLYGSDWIDNDDGTFTATRILSQFSDLDLYLMGLLDPSEVNPLVVLENASVPSEAPPGLGDVVSATAGSITIDQIIEAEGQRIPGFSESPNEHRIAVIYLVEPGAEIDQAELRSIDEIRSLWRRSFFRETGGRAVVDVAMAGTPPISTPDFDLQAARIWLETAASGGLWQDSPTTIVRDTSESLTALARFASAATTVAEGVEALSRVQATSIELAARQAEVLALNGDSDLAAALVGDLVEHHDQAGAWGAFDRYSPDVVSAGAALRALAVGTVDDPLTLETWSWMTSQQNPDGGWAWRPGGPSAVYPTLAALHAGIQTRSIDEASPVGVAATNWLLLHQRSDGGFGDGSSGIVETALFLRACRGLPIDQASINDAIIFLAQRQEANGSWEGRTLKTAVAITALAPYFMADPWVSAEEIFVTPGVPFVGDDLALQGAIRNRGGDLPAGTDYRWDLLDASRPDVVWASFSGLLPEIAAGGWAVVQDSWNPGVPAGSYLLRLVVDPESQIDDADPSNNWATLPLEVTAHPEGVDLAFLNGSLGTSPGSIVNTPQPITIFGTAKNVGLSPALSVSLTVFDGSRATGTPLGSTTLDIAPLGSAAFGINVVLPEPRPRFLSVVLDPDDLLRDENRADNTFGLDVAVTPTNDPGIVANSFNATPNQVTTGEEIVLEATIRNSGTEAVPSVQLAFTFDFGNPPTTYPISIEETTDPLEPGESRTVQTSWRPAVPGVSIPVRLEVDPQGLIQDLDLNNNLAETVVTIDAADLPNLSVSPDSLAFDTDEPLQGQSITIIGSIVNNGVRDSGSFSAHIRLDNPDSGMIVGTSTFPNLAPGTGATIEALWTVDGPEDRVVHLVVDSGAEVEEFNEEDNLALRVLNVQSLPDLVVTSGGIGVSPQFPHTQENVSLSIAIENRGDQGAGETTIELLDESGATIETVPLSAVSAHDMVSISMDWQAPTSSGEVGLRFRVNADHGVAEQRFDNNETHLTLAVQDGDFFLSSPYCSPNGDGVQDSVVLYFRQSLRTVTVADGLGETVKEIGVPTGAFSVEWDGRDDNGNVVSDAVYSIHAGFSSV